MQHGFLHLSQKRMPGLQSPLPMFAPVSLMQPVAAAAPMRSQPQPSVTNATQEVESSRVRRAQPSETRTYDVLEHTAAMHDYISEIELTMVKLQNENSQLKKVHARTVAKSVGKYLFCFGSLSLSRVLTAWRNECVKSKAQRERDSMEAQRLREAVSLESRITTLTEIHQAEHSQLLEEHHQLVHRFNQKLDDERLQATVNIDDAHQMTDEKQRELEMAQKRVAELEAKLEKAELVVSIVRERVGEYKTDDAPRLSLKHTDENQLSEFIKEKLHEILRCTDPRYLGRSVFPTVAEISSQERLAYAQQSVCVVGDNCLQHNQCNSPPPASPLFIPTKSSPTIPTNFRTPTWGSRGGSLKGEPRPVEMQHYGSNRYTHPTNTSAKIRKGSVPLRPSQ